MGSNPQPGTQPLTQPTDASVALKLRVVDGPDFGKELATPPGSYLVGQAPGSALRLTDPAVSRSHLLVEVLSNRLRLKDLGSRNGSTCNGMPFTEVEAECGAEIRVGRTTLRILQSSARPEVLQPWAGDRFHGLVGRALSTRVMFAELARIAATGADVLLQGETGTGKELCARALHQASHRARGPFVTCDLAAAARELFESELFGHVQGAFTDARAAREGAAVRAEGGTLFLDEVGELPLELQPKLLRLLDARAVKPVGGTEFRQVDVRVVAASHRDLAADVRAGRFREDLYHRLSVLPVRVPPLRERAGDIPLLVQHFLAELHQDPNLLEPQTMALLRNYAWPGNVRELRNVVTRVVSLGAAAAGIEPANTWDGPGAEADSGRGFHEAKERLVRAFERDYLTRLLEQCEGNVRKAAAVAKLDRAYLYELLKRHEVDLGRVRRRRG